MYCLTSTPSGDILASACKVGLYFSITIAKVSIFKISKSCNFFYSKASKLEHASILIWDTLTWKQTDSLPVHTLTVTQLAFSDSGNYLLSVSRDRLWAVHARNEHDLYKFSLIQCTDKKTSIHTRIIWSCSWFADENYFVTASRDKKVIVWGRKNESHKWDPVDTSLDVAESATSVCVATKKTSSERSDDICCSIIFDIVKKEAFPSLV